MSDGIFYFICHVSQGQVLQVLHVRMCIKQHVTCQTKSNTK